MEINNRHTHTDIKYLLVIHYIAQLMTSLGELAVFISDYSWTLVSLSGCLWI